MLLENHKATKLEYLIFMFVGPLPSKMHNAHLNKAEALNAHFNRCFNHSVQALVGSDFPYLPPEDIPDELLCNVEKVRHMLSFIDVTRSKQTRQYISVREHCCRNHPCSHQNVNISLSHRKLQVNGKPLTYITPIPKSTELSDLVNYRPPSLL